VTEQERIESTKFENELIHQRLTWLGTFSGLLFVANNYDKHPFLLPIVGFAIAFSIDWGIQAGNKRLEELSGQAHKNWKRVFMPGVMIPKVVGLTWVLMFLWNFVWVRNLWACVRGT
jgi:hypothetical protein